MTAPSADTLRARFDALEPGTIGLEEEVMVLDSDTFELAPRAPALLDRLDGDPRYTLELPAAQLEIVVGPAPDVPTAIGALARARAELAAVAAAEGLALAAAGVHPTSSGVGSLNPDERYAYTRNEYAPVAVRQLVSALQVHVAVGGAERTRAVHNALRSYLPLIAALAANAPFYEDEDTGLASVRPKLSELLPRQGVPPAIASWEDFAGDLAWAARGGARTWWWELRPHILHGTLELRVPDAQATVAEAAAVAAVAHSLVTWLAARHDAGDSLPSAPTWRIAENRWSACRHGVEGTMLDLETGEGAATRDLLARLLDDLAGTAASIGALDGLGEARALLARGGGASALRRAAAGTSEAGGTAVPGTRSDPRAAARWLTAVFCAREAG